MADITEAVLQSSSTKVCVIAGPGCRKTTGILIPKAKQILADNNVAPAEVLLLTFSRLSALDLKSKSKQLDRTPRASTVHSFCLSFLLSENDHLMIVLFLALLLLFAVLLFEFRTFSAPAAILGSALLSTFGGFLALLITGTTFNVASRMGMIMVIGIVAKNGILLLDAEHRFRDLGFSAEEAMIQAGRRRLRPIAMTALATVAGMLPLAFGIGAGSEMLKPLAIVVIGGLLSSMVLSLVFTPAIHYYLRPRHTEPA